MRPRLAVPALLACSWFGITQTTPDARANHCDTATRISRIENGFAPVSLALNEPPTKFTIRRLMEISNVTQLSVAVFDDNKLAWAKGYGTTDSGAPVTPHTPFPSSSVSKPVSALAALRLVEQGKLSLDEDVNRKLKSWKVPENEFTKDQKVTLRRILTHTAGTTVHGFFGYAPGQPVPTLRQVLDGEKPANSEPIRVDFVPGTKQRYSGGGFTVMQQLMIDVAGKPFPQIMQQLVLDPLGLKDSTYDRTRIPRPAATGRDNDGEAVPTAVWPELAAGGLWTTPTDLGQIALDVAWAKAGKSPALLSQSMAREMLRLQSDPKIEALEGPSMRMGLGWQLGDDSESGQFQHSGVNTGFSAEMFMWDSGHGVVVMMNNWSFESRCVVRYLINNIAEEYGWKFRYNPYTPWPYADTVVLASAKLRGVHAAIDKYHELKELWAKQMRTGSPLTVVWTSNPPDFPPSEWDLYGIAHVLAHPKHLYDAVEIMKVEATEYPKWPQAHRYLGELCESAGNKPLAISSYETLLKLNPADKDAKAALQRLTRIK